jgi:hypothetical protein
MNAVLGLDMETRRELRTRGEPVAIAVGLRAQDPEDRVPTLAAIADLPSRDAKVEFISRVNEQRRAGVPIEEAIAAVRAAGAVSAVVAASPSRPAHPRRPVVGRPARITLPFVWRQVGPDWWDVDVHPSVLATTRLAAQRSASVSEWRDAICADLTAFRDASATAPDGGQAWTGVVEALSTLLDTVGPEIS